MKYSSLVKILRNKTRPLFAVLIDPDKYNPEVVVQCNKSKVDCFLVGGSLLEHGSVQETVSKIKRQSDIPVLLFPGDENQLSANADGLLLLSLLSGRNPEYLIEKHVRAAPVIKRMKLPVLSTAYLLIDSGSKSATQQVTQTEALDPADISLIVNTALAAQQLGFSAIYLEAGSGSGSAIPATLISKVKKSVSLPVIVGGGIDSALKASCAVKAGGDMVVVGNAFEKNVYLVPEISRVFIENPRRNTHKKTG